MNTPHLVDTTPVHSPQPSSPAAVPGGRPHRRIVLGIDLHVEKIVVVRQLDGATPQPAQRFTPEAFLHWAAKQTALAEEVHSCYEAGPCGFVLHRQLLALGIENLVIRPRDWDEYGQRVKTDRRDARQMALCLERYVTGNQEALHPVRVPTPEEEQRRSDSRLRQRLQSEKQRLAAQARGDALYYGHRLKGPWWTAGSWKRLQGQLPEHLLGRLERMRRLVLAVDEELQAVTQALEAQAPADLPLGLGRLSCELLEREVGDWNRFANRRQVASYTGLCPREDSSGHRRFQGAINKHGNRRVRPVLIECTWRLCVWQPGWRRLARWRPVLADPKTPRARRKKIIVALARQLAIDWWRVRTGRCTPQSLGLLVK